MELTFTAVIKQDGKWWIGWVEEISGVNCQESTKEDLLESLCLALREHLVELAAERHRFEQTHEALESVFSGKVVPSEEVHDRLRKGGQISDHWNYGE